jgi:hypothetical protein
MPYAPGMEAVHGCDSSGVLPLLAVGGTKRTVGPAGENTVALARERV